MRTCDPNNNTWKKLNDDDVVEYNPAQDRYRWPAYHYTEGSYFRVQEQEIRKMIDYPGTNEWFATFGMGTNLARNFVLVKGKTINDALEEVAKVYGYTKSGAVRCAFVYPISELKSQIAEYGLTEVPFGTPWKES